jgi:3D (Asp-Asp-Asp) domain-containing protein
MLVVPGVSPAGRSAGVHGLRVREASLAAQTRSAVLSLYALDSQVAAAQSRLDGLRARARSLQAERSSLSRRLRIARLTVRISQQRLASRVRYLYDHGSTSALELLFGSRSIDDALTDLESLRLVTSVNDDVLEEARSARAQLDRLAQTLAIRARSLDVATQEASATTRELVRARAARSAYAAGLVRQRRVTLAMLAHLETQADAAAARSRQLPIHTTAPAALAAGTAPVTSTGRRTLTVVATGYSLSGRTATGLPVGWGVIAVDPSVIPFGTHLSIPGYGEAVAADTGGAVVGATIDVWFPSAAQAERWGRRSITIALH